MIEKHTLTTFNAAKFLVAPTAPRRPKPLVIVEPNAFAELNIDSDPKLKFFSLFRLTFSKYLSWTM
jgi:hypothetical protein